MRIINARFVIILRKIGENFDILISLRNCLKLTKILQGRPKDPLIARPIKMFRPRTENLAGPLHSPDIKKFKWKGAGDDLPKSQWGKKSVWKLRRSWHLIWKNCSGYVAKRRYIKNGMPVVVKKVIPIPCLQWIANFNWRNKMKNLQTRRNNTKSQLNLNEETRASSFEYEAWKGFEYAWIPWNGLN